MPDLAAAGLGIHYASAPHEPRRPAVVLLHGAGANHSVWLAQLAELKDRAWIVLPDLPGHGRSDPIPGLSIAGYARALVPFLEAIRASAPGAGGITLGGHSMGGAIAIEVALARPDLVEGLVLVASGAKLGVSREILDGLASAPRETQALIVRWSFAPATDPALIVKSVREIAGTTVERIRADFGACNAFDARERIGAIAAPALVICGREDRMTPPRYSEFLAERIPRATLTIIEGAGHSVMVEAPREVSEAIAGFVARSDPRL